MAKVTAEVGSTANRYQILAKLAAGGMAEIFLARGASVAGVERYCVLKRITRERAGDAQFAQMFLDEARLVVQLQHPNIAAVYDIGMLGDSYFFTMEYVHGETVRSLVQRAQGQRRPVPLACALTIIAGAAAGLHHAHERNATDGRPLGIVHRDVSPSNLMVSYEGNVKVVDFGVAKAAGRAVETNAGVIKGKSGYLSPEQCRSERVDRRSDLFSLGIVMWELLTGARLYRRDSDFESMTAIVHETPSAPSLRRAELPRAVDDIVLRLLAKSADDRFQTAAELVEAIEHAAMRARTILSASAVARLVRDLFGTRAEPWLEFEADTPPWEAPSLVSQPILFDGARTQTEVKLQLASMPDARPVAPARVDPLDATLSAPNTAALSRLWPPPASSSSPPSRLTRGHRVALGVAAAITAVVVWFAIGTEVQHARVDTETRILATAPVTSKPIERAVDGDPGSAQPALPKEPATRPAAPHPRRTQPERAAPERPRPAPMHIAIEARGAPHTLGERAPTPLSRAPSALVLPPARPAPALPPPAPPAPAPLPPALPSPALPFVDPSAPRPRSLRVLAAQYERGDRRADYGAVLDACSAALVSAEIVKLCLYAACNMRNPFEAKRWLLFAPDAEREIAYCKTRGIGLGASALDCRHDLLDCQ